MSIRYALCSVMQRKFQHIGPQTIQPKISRQHWQMHFMVIRLNFHHLLTLVLVMASSQTGGKPLFELIMTHFPEAFINHDDVIIWKHFPRYWPFVRGNSPVTGEFPAQRPMTRSFDIFFDLRLNKRLSKQSWGRWFETPSCPLWRHRNASPGSSELRAISFH